MEVESVTKEVAEVPEAQPVVPTSEDVARWRPVQRGLLWLQATLIVTLVAEGVTLVALISFPGFAEVPVVTSTIFVVPCVLMAFAVLLLRRGGPDAVGVRLATRAIALTAGWGLGTVVTAAWIIAAGVGGPDTVARSVVETVTSLFELGVVATAVALLDHFAVQVGRFDVCVRFKRLPAVAWMLVALYLIVAAIEIDGSNGRDAAALTLLVMITLFGAWFTMLGAALAMTAQVRRILPDEAPVATTFD